MYKLFLTFRYLTRKKIVIFPILVVWLCVMMLIIVSSIMGGFVDRVRETNHDLLGDIIISSRSYALGFSHYDDLRHALEKRFPDIEATTPTVQAYGLVYIPEYKDSRPAILVGVNPEERAKVTRFRESLFNQYGAPTQAVDDLTQRLPASKDQLVEFARQKQNSLVEEEQKLNDQWQQESIARMKTVPHPRPNYFWIIGLPVLLVLVVVLIMGATRKRSVLGFLGTIIFALCGLAIIVLGLMWPIFFPRDFKLLYDHLHRVDMDLRQADRTFIFAQQLPAGDYKSRDQLYQAIVPPEASFSVPKAVVDDAAKGPQPLPPDGCIIGSQMGFFERDPRGNFVHPIGPLFMKVVVTVFPANEKGSISVNASNAVQQAFTIVDDSHTGVFDIDQTNVYVPFAIAQRLAGLSPDPELVKQDPSANFDPRCQEILIKLKGNPSPSKTAELRAEIGQAVQEFQQGHSDISDSDLDVQTWDEKQARYLGAVENEKVMIIFILLLMSVVVLVVIFLIFYQIVRDKTRDIGIIKAVGGSEEGVAGIFLAYGLLIGIVGGGLGVLGGVLFVTHTNQIHEGIFQATGIVIWDRSVYLFDRIPDVVHFSDVAVYFIVALVAGVLGALIPAVIAALEDPVQAVRYE